MTTFLLDLWQDLRAKRLWPVAVVLLAGTLAVPVLMSKPASSPQTASTATHAAASAKLPSVALDASSVSQSHLNVFKQRNPFGSLSDPAQTTTAAGASVAAGVSGVSSSATTASTGTGSSAVSSSSTGGGGSTSSTGSTGSSGSVPAGPDGKPVTPGVHYFTYTVDVRFGQRGHLKTYKGVSHLDVLPDGQNPILAFMGAKSGKSAMFFIADPAFRVDGEGKCQPSPDNCMFLWLRKDGAHNEATLTAQNGRVEYDLELLALHTKSLSQNDVTGNTTPQKRSANKRTAKLVSLPEASVAKR